MMIAYLLTIPGMIVQRTPGIFCLIILARHSPKPPQEAPSIYGGEGMRRSLFGAGVRSPLAY